ncbi:MAG: T9SS type A sorting domain-containing protein [Bacteroidales bacterium]|nr:T9SS type A sorting domain-containing protein [Bacteroidales bacterium]
MRRLFIFVSLISSTMLFSQQITVPRIETMPEMPQPYEMRDWQEVARKYDSLVYDRTLSGTYLPLVTVNDQSENDPEQESFVLQTYVGSFSPTSGEAINMMPSVIGATLCGIDKSNQFGKNWAAMCENFFNTSNGENVYLNNPLGESGHDWWYETMPNIFFYQLRALYPGMGDFETQFKTVADRWYEAVRVMGGNNAPWNIPEMTYRAWNLLQMEPLTEGVKEPEAAGALAWIFHAAYRETEDPKYLEAAEWCMEFLNGLDTNPSYELQLAYGTVTAAKMNAGLGTGYNLEKMVNWCFDIGPLRNWGAITGTWGGLDCHGLIGEQAPGGTGYAFTMNGFQQAAALAPLVRYDERYADAIGKWILNLANNSRLFYHGYLPTENQDENSWSTSNDPASVIAYEALKESLNGQQPYATGDAVDGGWAATNLALYGSSHVGMLGGIIQKTAVDGILRIDLLKSDFYRDSAFSTYLFYNPYPTEQLVETDPGNNLYDLYESISNQLIATGRTGATTIHVPPESSVVVVILPGESTITTRYAHTLANGVIIDYRNDMEILNHPPRIKSLAAADTLVLTNSDVTVYCTADDPDGDPLQYKWSAGNGQWTSENTFSWPVPETPGNYLVSCIVKDAGELTDTMYLDLQAVERITAWPAIVKIAAENRKLHPGSSVDLWCEASDINDDPLQYRWTANQGAFQGEGAAVSWNAPDQEGIFTIWCEVTNLDDLSDLDSLTILVKDSARTQEGTLVAGFYLDGNGKDFSAYHNDGIPYNITWVPNHAGSAGKAAALNGSSSRIVVPDTDYLNFNEGLSLLCRIKPEQDGASEQFIVSHGSWQNRWKLSLISNNKLRFTINGSAGITDLDSETLLQTDQWVHIAATYDGLHMELYIDGELDSFKPWNGTINKANHDLLFGQMLPENASYNFKGCIDDARIYNYGVKSYLIDLDLSGALGTDENGAEKATFLIRPNPANASDEITLTAPGIFPGHIWISTMSGRIVWSADYKSDTHYSDAVNIPASLLKNGIYLISLRENGKTYTQKLMIL